MGLKLKSNGDIIATTFTESEDPSVGASILDYTTWTEGTGSVGVFGRNGDDAENVRLIDSGPFGSTIVWETRPTEASGADGGWNTSQFSVDETKLYRFSVWVRNTGTVNSGNYYHGCHGYPSAVIEMSSGASESNPYFDCPGIGSVPSDWMLSVGHIYPSDTTETGRHPDTGRWNLDGVKFSTGGCNIGSGDVKWAPGTTTANERVYHYYSTSTDAHLQFAFPRVEVVDGTEPTIQQLINNFEVKLGNTIRVGELDEVSGAPSGTTRIKRDGTLYVNGEFIEE